MFVPTRGACALPRHCTACTAAARLAYALLTCLAVTGLYARKTPHKEPRALLRARRRNSGGTEPTLGGQAAFGKGGGAKKAGRDLARMRRGEIASSNVAGRRQHRQTPVPTNTHIAPEQRGAWAPPTPQLTHHTFLPLYLLHLSSSSRAGARCACALRSCCTRIRFSPRAAYVAVKNSSITRVNRGNATWRGGQVTINRHAGSTHETSTYAYWAPHARHTRGATRMDVARLRRRRWPSLHHLSLFAAFNNDIRHANVLLC